jgi:uncharacterized protein YegL
MSNPFEQKSFDAAEFAENPEPRCPCLLLLDVSGSMRGKPITELNDGLVLFKDEVVADSLAAKRVEIGVVTFGPVQTVNDFTSAQSWTAPILQSQADTPIVSAVEHGLALLRNRKDAYRSNAVSYYRPWIFLITDGAPTDGGANNERLDIAARLIKEGEAEKAFSFFPVGVEGANFDALRYISARDPLGLKELRFRDLFSWLSSSLSSVSRSSPGDAVPLQNPASPNGWGEIK